MVELPLSWLQEMQKVAVSPMARVGPVHGYFPPRVWKIKGLDKSFLLSTNWGRRKGKRSFLEHLLCARLSCRNAFLQSLAEPHNNSDAIVFLRGI